MLCVFHQLYFGVISLSTKRNKSYHCQKWGVSISGWFASRGENCRKTETLPQKLDKGDPRPMGPGHNAGVLARTPWESSGAVEGVVD